jgi:hypothetical protein
MCWSCFSAASLVGRSAHKVPVNSASNTCMSVLTIKQKQGNVLDHLSSYNHKLFCGFSNLTAYHYYDYFLLAVFSHPTMLFVRSCAARTLTFCSTELSPKRRILSFL